MSETITTMYAAGDTLETRVPSEDAVERLAFALAVAGAHPDDRCDADIIRERVTDAQRHIARQHLVLSMNSEVE